MVHVTTLTKMPHLAFHDDKMIGTVIYPNDDVIFGGDTEDTFLTIYMETVEGINIVRKQDDFTYFRILRDHDSIAYTNLLAEVYGFSGDVIVDTPDKHMNISYSYAVNDGKLPPYRTSTFDVRDGNVLSVDMYKFDRPTNTQITEFGVTEILLTEVIEPFIIKPISTAFKIKASFNNWRMTGRVEEVGKDKVIEYLAIGDQN